MTRLLVFGEDATDAEALRELVQAIRGAKARVEVVRRPPTLKRGAAAAKRREWADVVAGLARAARRSGPLAAVIVHRDLDAVEEAGPNGSKADEALLVGDVISALGSTGVDVVGVSPAWEMEAWWFLWPDAVASHRPSWSKLAVRPGQEVDRIRNAKEALRKALRPKPPSSRCPEYSPQDGPRIARKVRELGIVASPVGRAEAFTRFSAAVAGLP